MPAKVSASVCAAQPVTMMRAARVFAARLADGLGGPVRNRLGGHRAGVDHRWRPPSSVPSPAFSASPRMTSDS